MQHFFLPTAVILEATGADCRRYLNARLTNDVTTLEVGGTLLAAALNAQGKTEALFQVYCAAEQRFLLVCDGGEAEAIQAATARFIVADRVEVADKSEQYCVLHLTGEEQSEQSQLFEACEDTVCGPRARGFANGIDWLIPQAYRETAKQQLTQAGSSEVDSEQQLLVRTQAAIPAFPSEVNQQRLFSEAGLAEAVSFEKGCYVGQEVVEKLDAYARLPYRLVALVIASTEELSAGDDLQIQASESDQQEVVGSLVTAVQAKEANQVFAFARVKNSAGLSSQKLSVKGYQASIIKPEST